MKWEKLFPWIEEEYHKGNRIKASKLMKIMKKMARLHGDNYGEDFWDKYYYSKLLESVTIAKTLDI